MKNMDLKQKLSELGISEAIAYGPVLETYGAVQMRELIEYQRKCREYFEKNLFRPLLHAMIAECFPVLPLGSSSTTFQKRSFDYELIGGV